jgi:HPt (histidine-containing phosphotransfer) domain-containing protein
MINWEDFNSNFQYYGDEVSVQIIDMFAEDHVYDMKKIEQCILEKDFPNLQFNAHHLKGTLGNFMDPEAIELSRKLEVMAANNVETELAETFAELNSAVKSLAKELYGYKKRISS